jgi:hypothetical protein
VQQHRQPADAIIERYRGLNTGTAFVVPQWPRSFSGEKRQRTIGVLTITFEQRQLAAAAERLADDVRETASP